MGRGRGDRMRFLAALLEDVLDALDDRTTDPDGDDT